MTLAPWDAVVVGAGHNGLTAATYLAGAGLRVIVLERQEIIGGATATEELWPGYRFGTGSYLCHMLQRPVIDDLDLRRHGLEINALTPSATVVLEGGRAFRVWEDGARTVAEIAALPGVPRSDAEAYPRWVAFWRQAAEVLRHWFLRPAPDLDEIRSWASGTEFDGVLETLLEVPMRELLERHFSNPDLAGALCGICDDGALSEPGSALAAAYIRVGYLTPSEDYGIPTGGMGAIAGAMAGAAREVGVEIRTGAPVSRLIVENGQAAGVILDSGEEIRAERVLSNADPKRTFLDLVPEEALPADFVEAVRGRRTQSASVKLHASLRALPDVSSFLEPGNERHAAMLRIMPPLDAVEQAWNDALEGRPADVPLMQVQIPSLVDPSLAPKGRHTMSVWAAYMPPAGVADVPRQKVIDRILDQIETHMPDLRQRIINVELSTPQDIAGRIGMTDGNIRHLDLVAGQLFADRPLPGWSDYRTPVDGLYLCGAGTHPGGEVTGCPGHNAAHAVLASLGRGGGIWAERAVPSSGPGS